MMFRSGIGYDVHQLVAGRPLILGGVHVESEKGLSGHSDADVLTHAIADALLGAASLGDIGSHFPDTDPKWKDANSLKLLGRVSELLTEAGFSIANVDATVVLESPRLRPYIDEMKERLAECLNVNSSDISVKATTSEKMGFVGNEEGAAALATCSIYSAKAYG